MKYAIGVNLGGTNIRAGIISKDGDIIETVKEKTGLKEKEGIEEQLFSIIEKLKKKAARDEMEIAGIGIGAPGPMDKREGIIIEMPNFKKIKNWSLKNDIKKRFQLPTEMEKDSNTSLLGESWKGAAKNKKNVVLLTLGTGTGGAALVNGCLLEGASGEAAEFGHITIDPNGETCGCGKRGCLETFCGAVGILRMAKEEGLKAEEAKDVFVLAREKNKKAQKIIDKFNFALSGALGDLINIFDPELVIFSGKISLSSDVFFPGMKKRLDEFCFRSALKDADINKSEIIDKAGLLGAASLILRGD